MDDKIKTLFGFSKLNEENQQAAELYFNEAIQAKKSGNELNELQNIDSFVKILGIDLLPPKECKDVIEKIKYIFETLSQNKKISKDMYSWETGLWSKPLIENSRKRKVSAYLWETTSGKMHENVKTGGGLIGQNRAEDSEDKEVEKIDKSEFHWKEECI